MVDELRNKLEETIEKCFDELETSEAGSEKRSNQVEDIRKLYQLKLEEDKQTSDMMNKAADRGAESERLEQENALKKEEIRVLREKGWIEGGKVVLVLLGNAVAMRKIMKFEETGTIATKAFQFLAKPKLL